MSVAARNVPIRLRPRVSPAVRALDPCIEFQASLIRLLPDLQRTAAILAGNRADAEDLAQETCRRALAARGGFRAGSNLKAWLRCIMRNVHRDRLRRGTPEILIGDLIDGFGDGEREACPAWRRISDEALARAVSALPPVHRETYVLYAIKRLSYAEISRIQGVPANTIGVRLNRARLQLRQSLAGGPTIDPVADRAA